MNTSQKKEKKKVSSKKQIYLINFLQTNSQLTVNFYQLYLTGQMKGYPQLKLPMMIYLKQLQS